MVIVLYMICVLAAVFLIASLIAINRRETSPIQKGLNFTGLAAAVVIGSALIGLGAKDTGTMEVAALLEGAGQTMFVVALAFFSIRSCGMKMGRAPEVVLLAYLVLNVNLLLFLGRSLEAGPVFYFHQEEKGILGILYYGTGICNALICALAFHFTYNNYCNKKLETNQGAKWIAVINLVPAFGILLLFPVRQLLSCSLLPVVIAATWIAVVVIVYRYRMFDSLQMARDDIIETIEEGFVVIDALERILFVNERAKEIFPQLSMGDTRKRSLRDCSDRTRRRSKRTGGSTRSLWCLFMTRRPTKVPQSGSMTRPRSMNLPIH